MSSSNDTMGPDKTGPDNAVIFQSVFDEAARHMKLGLEAEGGGNRMVGVAFVPAAHSSQDGQSSEQPATLDDSDKKAIKSILEAWETMHPDDFVKSWRTVATDPFIAIGPGWIKKADQKFIKEWSKSDGLAKLLDNFQPFRPRKTVVSQVEVVFVGDSLASATYTTTEETGKRATVGNAASILMKTPAGWRIAAITRHDRLS